MIFCAVKDLATLTFPTAGPAYDLMVSKACSQYLTSIWQTILQADYVVSALNPEYAAATA